MHFRPPHLVFLVLAVLALSACARADTPRDGALVAVRIEKVRAHLYAAGQNAAAGDWALAGTHAGHPAEDLQPIDAALARRDPKADAALRARLAAVRDAIGSRDSTVPGAIAAADRALEEAERLVVADASDPRFRAAVASELLELATTEYSDGVAGGAVRERGEYQDASAFLARARAFAPDVDPALAAAIPWTPATLLAPDRVERLVDDAKDALAAIAGPAYAPPATTDLTPLLTQLDAAGASVTSGDASAAGGSLASFRGTWTQVESIVKARSADAYARVENDMAVASAALAAPVPDLATAQVAIADMRAQLSPFVGSAASYGVFDAAIILVREGVEALLIVAALLAFLAKTGNGRRRVWIWSGGAAGIVASVGIAGAMTVAFSASERAGADRELLEGLTGLFAAAMLLYMSWWLHSKSNLGAWQRYVREKSGAALARNSLLGLSLVAFLAVFREGAETSLFYLGIAPSIAIGDLALGLLAGAAILAAIALAVLVFGVRIPIRPFFLGTSVLVYYLALKFVGAGVHALQVAGIVPASPRAYLPDIGLIGAFPTVETTAVQAALVAAALGWLMVGRRWFDTVAREPRRMGAESSARRRWDR